MISGKAENNIVDIDKEISFLEQKLQELKSKCYNIPNTSYVTHTDKNSIKIDKEAQRAKKLQYSGFTSSTSYIKSIAMKTSNLAQMLKFLGKTNTHRVQNHL